MRVFAVLSTLPWIVGAVSAQCLDTSGGSAVTLAPVGAFAADDEGVSAPIDMLLGAGGFPMAGAAGPLTHAVVDSNGGLYLTSGGAAVGRVAFGAIALDDLRGTAGDSPRVFVASTDLEGPLGTWAVTADTSMTGRFKVTWIDVQQYFGTPTPFRMSVSLFDTGLIEFAYGDLPTLGDGLDPTFTGVSIGNGVGTGTESPVDLAAGADSGALGLIFQQWSGGNVPSVAHRSVTLVPNGLGGYTSALSCQPAAHVAHGAGCYGDSVYDLRGDAAVASAALQGNSLTLIPTGTGYAAVWIPGGAAGFVTPVAATDLARVDDGQEALDLSLLIGPGAALPTPSGPVSVLYVHSNGFVSTGPANVGGAWNTEAPGQDYTPTRSFRDAPATAFWSWHDWDPSDTAGGPVRWHYDAGASTLYLTWDAVESYPFGTANPGTMQFQLHLATGIVDMLWPSISTDTTSAFSSAYLVGYSPGGASADPGSISFPDSGSTTTIDGFRALTLSASPDPAITGGGSSNLITYSIDNLPDYAAPAGLRLGVLFFSVASAPGIDLSLIGAPGCQVYVGTLDVQFSIAVLGAASQSIALTFPPPLAPGLSFFAQAVALIPAGSYPGGLNGFGLVTSNGIETRF